MNFCTYQCLDFSHIVAHVEIFVLGKMVYDLMLRSFPLTVVAFTPASITRGVVLVSLATTAIYRISIRREESPVVVIVIQPGGSGG